MAPRSSVRLARVMGICGRGEFVARGLRRCLIVRDDRDDTRAARGHRHAGRERPHDPKVGRPTGAENGVVHALLSCSLVRRRVLIGRRSAPSLRPADSFGCLRESRPQEMGGQPARRWVVPRLAGRAIIGRLPGPSERSLNSTMISTPALLGDEAVQAAGLAVNGLALGSAESIRAAVPIAHQAAVGVKSRSESSGWQIGRFTALPIAIFQNWLYEMNRQWRFTDGCLCVLWCVEFPDARSDYAAKRHYIGSTRRDYNNGKHQAPAPAVPSTAYDQAGNPLVGGRAPSVRPAVEFQARPGSRGRPRPAGQRQPLALAQGATGISPASALPPSALSSDPVATAARVAALDAYTERHVLARRGFCCDHFRECRASHPGAFFEGQLHHVGAHYDLTAHGIPLRIVVVGQEYGNGPGGVPRTTRTVDVVRGSGYLRRFKADGLHEARNPHMKGTTSVLRLMIGRQPGSDYKGELVRLGDADVHLFEAFALTNFLLCSAISDGERDTGSKRGKSTTTMQRNCAGHFREAMRILEPTVIIAQGKGVRDWMARVVDRARPLAPNVELGTIAGRDCLIGSFAHPSVPSGDNWGTDDRRPYLLNVVAPAVTRIRRELFGSRP
jgi:hypothetical protein